jgi:hypothetical protein
MRLFPIALLALAAAGCGSVEYRDNNAAVDARPECAGAVESRPGEGVPAWCDRSQEAVWSSGSESTGIRFGGDD